LADNKNILNLLAQFQSISLKEMDTVKLMNRTDTKYFFPLTELPDILRAVSSHYFILTINNKQIASYKTLYYDTSNFDIYITHHNGKLNRFKVRIRHYVDSDIFFLEKKFKNNKSRTIKKRIKVSEFKTKFSKEEKDFIRQFTSLNPEDLYPKLLNHFDRITLVQPNDKERITIDFNLGFSVNGSHTSEFHNIAIAEIKKDGRTHSVMEQLFRQEHIHPTGFSKYCTGIATLYPEIKHNRFKYKLSQIKKIEYGTA